MSGRQGGKLKPMKQAKKAERPELDDDAKAFLAKKKLEQDALKIVKDRVAGGGALGNGIKKSSGKKT